MLAETLQSIQRQSYAKYEVLILDNASPPAAQEIIRSYLQSEPRARVLRCEERLHMFDNFARGISAAQGQYLTFFHDDDIYLPEFLARHISLLEANTEVVFSGSNWLTIDKASRLVAVKEPILADALWSGERYIETLLRLGTNVVPMPGIVFRTLVLGPDTFTGSMDIHFSDFVILMRIAEKHTIGLIKEPLLAIRVHDNQASQEILMAEAIELRTRILLDYCAEFASRWPNEQSFLQRIRRSINRSRQIGLLWGWVTSRNPAEADGCLAALDASLLECAFRDLLTQVGHHGLSLPRRKQMLIPVLRRLGYSYANGAQGLEAIPVGKGKSN